MQRDTSYSPDVELDELGRVVFTRDVKPGETIMIPDHMMAQLQRQGQVSMPNGSDVKW